MAQKEVSASKKAKIVKRYRVCDLIKNAEVLGFETYIAYGALTGVDPNSTITKEEFITTVKEFLNKVVK